MVKMRVRHRLPVALLLGLGIGAIAAAARQIDTSKPPPRPPAQDTTPPIDTSQPPPPPPAAATAPGAATPEGGAPTPATPRVFDPVHAQKSVEVGEYYLKAGDYAAAIDRFKEAIADQSNFALPWDLLGQACEKEHQPEDALAAYQKYLMLLPEGKEPDRVRKRVTKLQADIARDAPKESNKQQRRPHT